MKFSILRRAFFLAAAVPALWAQEAGDDDPGLMKTLHRNGLHDLENERWNLYGQFTYISSWKPGFSAPYTNRNGSTNSLLPVGERSFTGSGTLYLGLRPWKGGEIYLVPEIIAERPLSDLRGLGAAIQNFELQKGGGELPTFYRSRLYLRQSFGLGGEAVKKESAQSQLGTSYDSRRISIIAGNFSILDFFDKTAFDVDPRQGFFSLGFMTHGAWDFASDARGYSWGAVTELYWDRWEARFARITPPRNPNQLEVDFRLGKYYGDQLEIEHHHKLGEQEGVVRLLGYRNHEVIGKFTDAVAAFRADPLKNATTCTGFSYESDNATAPDLCWARRPNNKVGLGLFVQQYVAKDIGIFGRVMYSDGKTEVDAYTAADRSASVGVLAKGSLWSRPRDVAGLGMHAGTISGSHAQYLALGGVDGFVGDGALKRGTEHALDLFYSVNVRKWLWLAGDFQHIGNPGFNRDRGPLNVFSLKLHGEF